MPIGSFDGKVAVITGAGSGIGRATAIALADRGARVVVSDVDPSRAEAVAAEIASRDGRATGVGCNVSSDADVDALATATHTTYGRVDVVMSNVGVIGRASCRERVSSVV